MAQAKKQTQTERRKHERLHTTNVSGSLLFRTQVQVVNISVTGMAIELNERLDVDRQYHIRFEHEGVDLSMTGKVVWCHLGPTVRQEAGKKPFYKAGIEFEKVLSLQADEVLRFMEQKAEMLLEQRVFGRFQFRSDSVVDLNSQYDFVVRTLSAGGMSIETELLPTPKSEFDMQLNLGSAALDIRGRVVHIESLTRLPERHQMTKLGIEFTRLSTDDQERLQAFLGSKQD